VDGIPSAHDLVWITVAMLGARSLAMALNRLIDARIDARNPRTAGREIPRGALTPPQVASSACSRSAVFLVAVFQLAPIVHWLWPIPVAGFVSIRTSSAGARSPTSGSAPWTASLRSGLGGDHEHAAVGSLDARRRRRALGRRLRPLYALFDLDVDRAQGLHSVPARYGVGAVRGARACHAATVSCSSSPGSGCPSGVLLDGVAAVAALLAYEHSLVSPRTGSGSTWRSSP
jgi:4-hydroxybenzoate polyprenyltransferase